MVSRAIEVESPKSYGPPHPWTHFTEAVAGGE
jgi:hypothetical protein